MKKKVLLSIKTKYVNRIIEGSKKYEYRKKFPVLEGIENTIYIYSSKDDKAIVGEMIISEIISGDAIEVSEVTGKDILGYADEYEGKTLNALKVKSFIKYDEPISLKWLKDKGFTVPQNYRYLDEESIVYKEILKRRKK
ncbi:MAG: hypothetical protein N4A47_05865 [Clostridia bacterium]|jgi:type I restriction enzyme S subunit|nr:hypothetical protein [Clostridia bacterium]